MCACEERVTGFVQQRRKSKDGTKMGTEKVNTKRL
jgi:hypothetical protein